jgi:hypothetical protein
MGLFSKFFGERVEIEVMDVSGVKRMKKVSKSEFGRWEKEGRTSKLPTVRAHISGLRGKRIEEWVIGAHVTKQAFEQFKDESTGDLYVGEVLEQGKPKQSIMPKKTWEDLKNT